MKLRDRCSHLMYYNKIPVCFGDRKLCVWVLEAALRKTDAVITAYRAHGWTYVRGVSVIGVLAELTGLPIIVTITI